MKNLKSLNLGKSLNRNEMKVISAGKADMGYNCTCGGVLTTGLQGGCGCAAFCAQTACP